MDAPKPRRRMTEGEVEMLMALQASPPTRKSAAALDEHRFVGDLAREVRHGDAQITSGQGQKLRALVWAAWREGRVAGRVAVLAEEVP